MLLTKTTPVPSGMSFDLDTGPAPRSAYLLSTPGNAAVITVVGTGVWTVEILASYDGLNFQVIGSHSLPGQWRYETKGVAAAAIRVQAYTSGTLVGMLTHGSAAPITNVSALFGSYVIWAYNSTQTAPPSNGQLRFNSNLAHTVTKLWIANEASDGSDQYLSLSRLPVGGTLLIQKRDSHLTAMLLTIVGPPIDKELYFEVPVAYQEHVGSLTAAQNQAMLVAVFSPGAALTLSPQLPTQMPAPPPRVAPVLMALDPPAMPLGSPDFTLRVLGEVFLDGDVIEWNGGIEPTTFRTERMLTTGVNMATAQVVMPIPIVVITPEGLRSNTLTFDLGGFPPAETKTEPEPETETAAELAETEVEAEAADELVDAEGFVIDEEDEEDVEDGAPEAKPAPKRRKKAAPRG